MSSLLIYEKDTGRVLICVKEQFGVDYDPLGVMRGMNVESSLFSWSVLDITVDTAEFRDRYYVSGAEVLEKSPVPATIDKTTVTANSLDFATIAGVPSGAELFIDGVSQGIADGTDIELTFDYPGSYDIKSVLFPYLDWEAVIYAT